MSRAVDPQEDILSQVFRRFLARYQMKENVGQPILVRLHQLSERGIVPLFGAQHELHLWIPEVTRFIRWRGR